MIKGMLQELTWHYVINNPALATQQHGYRIVIKGFLIRYWTRLLTGTGRSFRQANAS